MTRDESKLGGVKSHITREMIREYRKMPPEMRLAWLDDAAKLSYEGLTPRRRRIWEQFRKGDI
ncbi:MAG: hypothetical protein V2A66_09505 [Pseudomonadota bacterium]